MSKKKYYHKSKKIPTNASIGKGVNATIEHLRHAEEGTHAYDIYQKGVKENGHFVIEYRYLRKKADGGITVTNTFMSLGYFAPIRESGILIAFPDLPDVHWPDVQKTISDILPNGAKFTCFPNDDSTFYFIPLTPLVEKCVITCLTELDEYIRMSIDKHNNAVLSSLRSI